MELAFKNKLIRKVCESEDHAKNTYGVEVAEKLQSRLADLSAGDSVKFLPAGNPRKISDKPPHFMVDLCDDYSISFCPNHVKNPVLEDGNVDWSKVGRIKILEIEKNHG